MDPLGLGTKFSNRSSSNQMQTFLVAKQDDLNETGETQYPA